MACPRYKKASVVVTILVVVIYLDKTLEQGGLRQNGLDLNGAHVCRVDIPITYTITTYYATTYMSGYTTCCGFLCWARCQRWREKTKQASKKLTRQGLDVYLRCCKGWQRSSSKPRECSEAICSQGCSNGGTCVYPEICSCASGWKGYSCSEDVDECRRNKGGCHHLCSNRVGKPPVCLCRRGYINSKTNYKRCVGKRYTTDTFILKRLDMFCLSGPCPVICLIPPITVNHISLNCSFVSRFKSKRNPNIKTSIIKPFLSLKKRFNSAKKLSGIKIK
ncbi:unnamed protein product [Porites lobata]|uniref:EGF-like domain-containing protein n=1 Tax=Porites lobata TaxID=104759 RepID=A0ABN8PRJ5_9CNID|nr:unnamed protein product [Porites lobata]